MCIIISYSHRQSQRSAFVGPLTLSLGARPPAKSHRFAPHFNSLTHFESLDFDVSSGSISCCLPGLPSSTHCRTHAHPSAYPNLLHSPFLSLSLPSTALDLSWSRSRLTTFPSILLLHLHPHLQARGRANCSALWFLP